MRKTGRILLFAQMTFLMFSGLMQDFGAPHAIMYLVDIFNGVLLLCALFEKNKKMLHQARYVMIAVGTWLGYMLVTSFMNAVPFPLVIWALRNWGRGFVVFVASLIFLDGEDIRRLGKGMFFLFIIQFLLICFQFATMGYIGPKGYVGYLKAIDPEYLVQDHLGGIFGREVGGNGWNNVFCCVMLLGVMCRDYERKRLTIPTAIVMMISMLLAALLELKVFFLEFLVIQAGIPILFAIQKRLDRKLVLKMLLCAAVSYGVGLLLLSVLYPYHFWVIIGKHSIGEYERKSSAAYVISRINFLPQMNELFSLSYAQQLFGLGFGNCEYSNAPFFCSDFSRKFEEYHYHFCSHHTLYLEGGLMGLLLYLLIPLSAAMEHGIAILRKKPMIGLRAFGCLFAGLTAVNVLYNNAMRTELCYLNFFILASCYLLNSAEMYPGGEIA